MSGIEKSNSERLNIARELLNQFSRSEFKSSESKNSPTTNKLTANLVGQKQSIVEDTQSGSNSVDSERSKSQKKAKQRLRNKAVYYLSLREFSTQELRKKLRAGAIKDCETRYSEAGGSEANSEAENSEYMHGNDTNIEDEFSTSFIKYSPKIIIEITLEWLYLQIDEVVEDFKARGLVSDARFTEQVVHARKAKFGSSRIAYELKQKGVEDVLISAAVANIKTDELANAADICRKKYKTPPANRNEWASRARFLQSRGFSFDVIKKVLNQNIQDNEYKVENE